MNKEQIQALIEYRLKSAEEALTSAETLFKHKLYRGSANRAYYAVFYCALALLASKQLKSKSHSGVISLIGKHFVKTKMLSKESAKALYKAFEIRQRSDYEDFSEITAQQADELIENAKSCLKEVRKILKIEE